MKESELLELVEFQSVIDKLTVNKNSNIIQDTSNFAQYVLEKTGLFDELSKIECHTDIHVQYGARPVDVHNYSVIAPNIAQNIKEPLLGERELNEAMWMLPLAVLVKVSKALPENPAVQELIQKTYIKPFTDNLPNIIVTFETMFEKAHFTFDLSACTDEEKQMFHQVVDIYDGPYISMEVVE